MDTYLCEVVCVRVCVREWVSERERGGGSSLCSFLHEKWNIGAVWTLIPHQDRAGLKHIGTRKDMEKDMEKVYI